MSSAKKAIIFIVEGITDEIILQPIIQSIANHKYYTKIVYGDIYTKKWELHKSAKSVVGELMKQIKEETKFKNSNIAFIVQLIDTDGIFINDDKFIVDGTISPEDSKTYSYNLEEKTIKVVSDSSKESLLEKWHIKRDFVMALRKGITYSSSKIPFLLYFNSLNLDHVITNDILNKDDKEHKALQFIELNSDLNKFIDFFEKKSTYDSFESSWDEIISDTDWKTSKSNIKFLIEKISEIDT